MPPGERDREYAQGLSIWQHKQVLRHRRERMDAAQDRAGRARARKEIADLVETAWADQRSSVRTRQRLARHMGIGRVAMAGDSTSTSPPGCPGLGASPVAAGPVIEGESEEIATGQVPIGRAAAEPKAAARAEGGPGRRAATPGGTLLRRLAQEVPCVRRDAEDDGDDIYAELGIHGTRAPKHVR